ncbi:hypothetical protein AKO1_000442, partial [Acrasis kona]
MFQFRKIFRTSNRRVFQENTGTAPSIVAHIFIQLLNHHVTIKQILITLHFLKQYTQQVNACSLFGVRIDVYNECIRDVMFKIVTIIGPLEFGWEKRLNQVPPTTPLFQNCWTVIDATECNIERPQDYRVQELYYSGKKKRHTMKYHVVCNITNGRIIDVHGPFFGRNHDIAIARSWIEDNQIQRGEGEIILGDSAYVGLGNCLTPIKSRRFNPLDQADMDFNNVIGSARIVVEQSINRIKKYKCFTERWRNDRSLHPLAFYTASIISAIEIRTSFPIANTLNNILYL